MSHRGNKKFKTFRCLKTKFKANTTTQGNAFIIDISKTLLSLKRCGGLKTLLNPPGATVLVCKI